MWVTTKGLKRGKMRIHGQKSTISETGCGVRKGRDTKRHTRKEIVFRVVEVRNDHLYNR